MITNQIFKLSLVIYTCACVNKAPTKVDNTIKDPAVPVHILAPDSFEPGKMIDSVFCKSDPTQSYALYIPLKGDKHALPVIYFFDAHADGALPLNKYKSLADAYGFILIGSNNSKNGDDWSTTETIWSHLFEDTRNRLNINGQRIYTCGFSGGAKVAGYVALNYPEVKGVIANGAGLPDGTPAGDFNFSFTAIAGEGDMNLTDLVSFSKALDHTQTRHHIIFFDGKHEWAPVSSMNLAFAGLQLDAMQNALIPKDVAFINRYITNSKMRLDRDYKANLLLKAGQECKLSISFLDGLTDKAVWFREQAAELDKNTLYQKQLQVQTELLAREQTMKEEYMQHFQQDDMGYWVKTIQDLQTRSFEKTSEGGMYQRLLAFLSLAFYSYSNQLINNNENAEAGYFVTLYKMVDPSNSEAWYFSAILHARDRDAKSAEEDLLKAVGYGFRDESRMRLQPEFQNLSLQMNFPRIENAMHVPLKVNGT